MGLSAVLLFAVIFLLLFTGQTIIFLLRLVAADRRGRRRPLASDTKTVGELEDAAGAVADGTGRSRSRRGARRPPQRTTGAASRGTTATPLRRHRTPCDNSHRVDGATRTVRQGGPHRVPVLATYFSVRRGRDPFFKFFMRTIFPKQVKDYEEKFGIRFIGWYNVAHGWDFDNVILLDLPDYATLDKLEADEGDPRPRPSGREWIFERHHSMFLRERMGPDLEYHP